MLIEKNVRMMNDMLECVGTRKITTCDMHESSVERAIHMHAFVNGKIIQDFILDSNGRVSCDIISFSRRSVILIEVKTFRGKKHRGWRINQAKNKAKKQLFNVANIMKKNGYRIKKMVLIIEVISGGRKEIKA